MKYPEESDYNRYKLYLTGNTAYQLFVSGPEKMIYGERVEPFFNSVEIIKKGDGDIYTDKTELFFSDLQSVDTLKSKSAALYCYFFNFNESYIDSIYSILIRKFPDDEEVNGVRAALLNSLYRIKSDTKIDFIRELYPQLSGFPNLQTAALAVLSSEDTEQSVETFLDLILIDTPHPDVSYNNQFSTFYYSAKNLSLLFPKILKLLEYEDYKKDIYQLLRIGIDSMVVKDEQYIKYKSVIIEDFKKIYAEKDTVSDWYQKNQYSWELNNIIRTFSAFKDSPEAIQILKDLVDNEDLDISTTAVVCLIILGEEVTPENYLRIAESVRTRINFYDELNKISKTNLFPLEYYSQNYFAESDLYRWLYYDDSEVDTLILLDTRKTEEGNFYLYKFNFDYEEDTYYIGISGPQPSDEKLVTTKGSKTKTHYSAYEDSKIENYWDELLKDE
jgi:hypothetical protein